MQGRKGINRTKKHLAMLRHELRNALNGVLGVTQMLGESELNGEQQEIHKALRQSGGQLRWLIEAMDPQGRTVEFPSTPVPDTLNGIELLEQVIRCHTAAAALKSNLLLLTLDVGLPPWWHVDARLLRQVIDNLLCNAIKFTRSGLVELEVRQATGKRGEAVGIELRVRDSGPGIPEADSRRIFEPGVQLEDGPSGEGAGLGLYVCSRIVSALNGQIEYCRGSGNGGCFRVYLPDALASPMHREKEMASDLYSIMKCLVSVRDDLRKSLESILARLGIRFGPARNGRAVDDDVGLQILISETQSSPATVGSQNGLQFTPIPPGGQSVDWSASKRLRMPYLESTLGPLLMEMALEWRMENRALNPGKCQTRGGTGCG